MIQTTVCEAQCSEIIVKTTVFEAQCSKIIVKTTVFVGKGYGYPWVPMGTHGYPNGNQTMRPLFGAANLN
jgi:hypothetical protein